MTHETQTVPPGTAAQRVVQRLRRVRTGAYVPYVGFVVIVATFGILAPSRFLAASNVSTVVQQSVVLAIVAMGMSFVIVAGSIDLSVGSVLALSGMVAAYASTAGLPAIPAGILTGLLAGAVNGVVFTFGRIPSFIVTLGMLSAARGLTIMVSHGSPVQVPTSGLFAVIGTPPWIFVTLVAVFLVCQVLYQFTVFGRRVRAIGGSERVALLNGIPVAQTKVLVFVLCGVLTGLAGSVLDSRIGAATPTAGTGFELDAISAVVIGGTPLTGGVGSVFTTIIGALIIAILANGLVIMGVPSEVQLVLKGIVLAVAVFVSLEREKIGTIK